MGKYHTVAQGECFSSLAHRHGFENYRTLYDHPKNAELRNERLNPNVLNPQDVVYIPENHLKEVDAATEQRHYFVLKREKTMFRLIVKDEDEKPYADTLYELKIDKKTFRGTTDDEGKLEEEISADAQTGAIVLYSGADDERKIITGFSLKFGHLDPVEKTTGVQSRLKNLGFDCGKTDGIFGKKTSAALGEFQKKYGLPETGEACAATREKLRRTHDWQ